jgi:hypothetical protein
MASGHVVAAGELPWAYVITNSDPQRDGFQYQGHSENLRVVLDLLRNDCRVEWVAALGADKVSRQAIVRRGDFLVPMKQRKASLAQIILAHVSETRRFAINNSFNCEAYPLKNPRILLDAHLWAGNYYWYYDTLLLGGFAFEHLYQHDEDSFDPQHHNLFVVPGGGGKIPREYNALLRDYVGGGGNYLGSCWGCAQALYPSKVSYGSGNGAGIADAHNDEITRSFGALGGTGHIVLRNDAPDHPIMWDLPREIHNIYWNGPVMKPGKSSERLASFVNVVADGFRFHSNNPEQRRLDAAEEEGKCLYLTSRRPGEGKVTVFGNHPEASNGVSPFRAHPMGYKAIYNAILFSTADAKRTITLVGPSGPAVLEAAAQIKLTEALASEAVQAVHTRSEQLQQIVARKLNEDGRRWTEDDKSGFFLFRLEVALKHLLQCSLAGPIEDDLEAKELRQRLERWSDLVIRDLERLAKRLAAANTEQLNRRQSTRWHAIVCPILERSIELTHLERDVQYYRKLRAVR